MSNQAVGFPCPRCEWLIAFLNGIVSEDGDVQGLVLVCKSCEWQWYQPKQGHPN